MSFIQKFKSSIYNPDFYSKIKTQGLGSTIGYFFLLALILTLINTLIASYGLLVKVPEEARHLVNETINSYPQNLEVKIEGGQVSTNADEPFFIPFPQEEEINQEDLNNILVIDTKTPFSATQFNQYKTLMWLTKDSLFYQNREFDQRSLDLSQFDNITINRSFVQDLAQKVAPWISLLGPALIIIIFIGMFIGFIFNLIYFFILALLIFFLSAIFKWGLKYGDSYKTAIYASTVPFLVDLLLINTGAFTGFFGFPFLFTLTALCVATINLQNFKEKS